MLTNPCFYAFGDVFLVLHFYCPHFQTTFSFNYVTDYKKKSLKSLFNSFTKQCSIIQNSSKRHLTLNKSQALFSNVMILQ